MAGTAGGALRFPRDFRAGIPVTVYTLRFTPGGPSVNTCVHCSGNHLSNYLNSGIFPH